MIHGQWKRCKYSFFFFFFFSLFFLDSVCCRLQIFSLWLFCNELKRAQWYNIRLSENYLFEWKFNLILNQKVCFISELNETEQSTPFHQSFTRFYYLTMNNWISKTIQTKYYYCYPEQYFVCNAPSPFDIRIIKTFSRSIQKCKWLCALFVLTNFNASKLIQHI